MGHSAKQTKGTFSYADYLKWPEDDRYEIIQGVAVALAAPSTNHQRCERRLMYQLEGYLRDKTCEPFSAPFDVVLARKEEEDFRKTNIVQPDITVICNPEIITSRGCEGVPNFIIEILSPGTYKKDIDEKYKLYESKGVKEYWIVSPGDESVLVYLLDKNSVYRQFGIFGKEDKVPVQILPGFEIDLSEIFNF